jgi:hypothetical protein
MKVNAVALICEQTTAGPVGADEAMLILPRSMMSLKGPLAGLLAGPTAGSVQAIHEQRGGAGQVS